MEYITRQEKEKVALQIIGIFVVPVMLLYFNLVPKDWRVLVLFAISFLVYRIIDKEKWRAEDLGLTKHTFKKYLTPYLTFIMVGVIGIMYLAQKAHMGTVYHWWTKPHFLFLFLVVSFLQEFTYRGFLIPLLKKFFSDRLGIVLINALLFTLLHIIYPIPQMMLPLAFIGGLAFAVIYMKYPNLWLVSIAHSVLNFVAVLHGFFVISQ